MSYASHNPARPLRDVPATPMAAPGETGPLTPAQLPTSSNTAWICRYKTVGELFAARTIHDSSRDIAVEAPSPAGNVERLTYAELDRRSNQLARHIARLGGGPDSVIGICTQRSVDTVVAVLGVLKAGSAYAALDPNYPPERLRYMIEDAKAPLILAQRELLPMLAGINAAKIVALDSDWPQIASLSSEPLQLPTTPEHLAYVIYTSGSTGKPKGVAMPHRPLINLLEWQVKNFSSTPAARTLQFASLNFDVSFQEILSTWCGGGTLVLISEEERRDPESLLQFIQRNRIERLFVPFVALKHLADAAQARNLYPATLREIITAGEQLQITPAIRNLFRRLPNCTLENQYGPSETHVVTAFRLTGDPQHWPPLPSIGRPVPNTGVFVLNESHEPLPAGETGELYIGGACLARGYLHRPELTSERFIPNPFGEGRLYKTGDLARFQADGNLEFLGRIDHQVKIRGYRIELGEIEAALSEHPAVREAVAMAQTTASGDKQLMAYVVANNTAPGSHDLRGFLRRHLPPHAIPAAFVFLEKLPLTPNGKVDRRALPVANEQPADVSESCREPRDPLEMQIRLVFEKFFRKRPIGIDASFFELGGDSLQALQLIINIERLIGKKLPMGILFRAATVEALARAIREELSYEFSCIVPLQPLGTKAPLFLVHTTPGDVLGYGNLIYHFEPDQPAYGFQSPGMDGAERCHCSIEEMAGDYIRQMRAVQPSGPYFIGGWCYGGIVAVEMAHQLQAAGCEVAPLLLIETPAHRPPLWRFYYYARRIRCLCNMSHAQWRIYVREKVKYYRGIKTADERRFRRVTEENGLSGPEVASRNRLLEQLELVYNRHLGILRHYKSRPYAGKVILFNAAEQDPALVRDSLYGWPGLADDIEVHVIPGNHDTILMEPHVRILAQQMTQCLERARR